MSRSSVPAAVILISTAFIGVQVAQGQSADKPTAADLPPVTVESEAEPKPTADAEPAPKPVQAKKSVAKKKKPAAPAPAPDVFEPVEAEAADAESPASAGPPGVPGTGTTGIDGYTATGTSTATKTNTPLKNIPQSISVVTKQQADDRGSESLGEALAYVPGVVVAQGEGHRDQITIRGQSTTADFFIDGVRDDAEYFRDLYNVEAIEVLKGPAAITFGRGGGGGVINRVTKKADGERVREATVNLGMYERKRTTVDVGDAISSNVAFRFNAMYEDSENFRDFFELERYAFNPKLAFKLSDQTKISLSYEYFKDDRTVDRGVPSRDGRPSQGRSETFFGNPDVSYSDFLGQTATATIEHRTDFGLNIRNQTVYADFDKVYSNTFAAGAVTPGNTVLIDGYVDTTLRENLINQTDLTYRWDLGGGIRHTFAAGTEFSRQETNNNRDNPRFNTPGGPTTITVPFANPTTFTPVFFNIPNRRRFTELEVASGYIQDQLEITKYFEVIGGLRYDRFDIAFENGLTGQAIDRVDDVWSPRLGFVVKPLETLSLYVSSSESFLPGAGDQFNNLVLVSGASLAPEGFENHEIGFKWEVAPRLYFTGALFSLDRTNQNVTIEPGVSAQVGLTRTEGGELSLTGYLTNDWQVSAGWGHQIAEIVTGNISGTVVAGKEVPFVPHNVYSLWNRYQLTRMFGAGVGVIHQTEQFAAADNLVTLPRFTRVDAALFVDFSENWSAQVNVENVFDEDYFASAHNNNNISPGAPRSAYVTVKATF
ncbi:MAG: TonB-dependent receptor [Hyphomicrobium sp.]